MAIPLFYRPLMVITLLTGPKYRFKNGRLHMALISNSHICLRLDAILSSWLESTIIPPHDWFAEERLTTFQPSVTFWIIEQLVQNF